MKTVETSSIWQVEGRESGGHHELSTGERVVCSLPFSCLDRLWASCAHLSM